MRRRFAAPFARIAAPLAALLALGACGSDPAGDASDKASPPLYEIANAEGEVEGWMLGTIHALPDGTQWRTPAIDAVIGEADLVAVEVANLEDREAIAATYTELSYTPNLPDLSERVSAEQRPALFELLSRSDFKPDQFGSTETWAAAIQLSQVGTQGNPANGVDRVVLQEFAGRPVHEFEGAEKQLRIFDQLAEEDQRELLAGVIAEARQIRDDPAYLRRAWLTGDKATLISATESGIMADPEVREALLVGRNRDWTKQLVDMLADDARPLIAVGAAHLVGPDGLGTMLEARGFTVTPMS